MYFRALWRRPHKEGREVRKRCVSVGRWMKRGKGGEAWLANYNCFNYCDRFMIYRYSIPPLFILQGHHTTVHSPLDIIHNIFQILLKIPRVP
jgi:hypothetical protein